MKRILVVAVGVILMASACSKGGNAKIHTGADSLAYIIGMNVGLNLQHMDSTINAEAVCEGIRDVLRGKTRLTVEEARTYYLRYVTYEKPEKVRAYEEQFLIEIREKNRTFARSESGLTYAVEEVGDEKQTPSNSTDTVAVRYVLRSVDDEQLYSSYDKRDTLHVTLGELQPGLQESLRLIGKGGKMQVWVPAALAYGSEGDKKLGVKPNATLYYEIELIDVRKKQSRGMIFN